MARSGRATRADECPLLGAKRTLTNRCLPISIYEYTPTWRVPTVLCRSTQQMPPADNSSIKPNGMQHSFDAAVTPSCRRSALETRELAAPRQSVEMRARLAVKPPD